MKQNDTYNNEEEQAEDQVATTNQDYLFGADLSLTQKYLARREKLKALSSQNKKEIDRKATKGRKIRYIVHDKLQNFMTAAENNDLLGGKQSILDNLFGQKRVDKIEEKDIVNQAKK